MSQCRSIGVLIPTRNSAALVPEHIESLNQWIDMAEEIVVVDSDSHDGTVEFLKANIRHSRVRYVTHPPGLYQSWNHGIRCLSSKYCYISTVGDSMTRDGLEHLHATIEALQCDVVVSKPDFIDSQGKPIRAHEWPMDDMLSSMNAREPVALEGWALLLFALVHYRGAIMGSSASNLYRTAFLRENPFPTHYGTAGDGALLLENCLKMRFGVTPEVFSTFREHPKSYSLSEYAVEELPRKLFQRIRQIYEGGMQGRSPSPAPWEDLVSLLKAQYNCQQRLESARHGPVPWMLNPVAWAARWRRGMLTRKIDATKRVVLSRL